MFETEQAAISATDTIGSDYVPCYLYYDLVCYFIEYMQAKSFLQVLGSIMFLCCKLPRDFGEFSINAERARKGMHVHMDSNISHSAFVF